MTNTQTVTSRPLTDSAVSYLSELETAVELAQLELTEAETTARRLFLMRGGYRSTKGEGRAQNSPESIITGRILTDAQERTRSARHRVGFAAWWFATAAIEAMEQRAAGAEVTARFLEDVTVGLPPGQMQEVTASAWMLPELPPVQPVDGRHDTGHPQAGPMNAALAELHSAYAAAATAEALDDPHNLRDWEVSEYHDAVATANRIPGLLITYARMAASVATGRL